MNELALFAGAGGGILGGILSGFRTICAVEKESYCREVLLRRQRDGLLPLFPIWDDIRTFDGGPWRGAVDVVTAGFPCQPFSSARKGRPPGPDDDRNQWPQTLRVIRQVGPDFVFLENVSNLLALDYFGQVLGDLAESGFDAEWGTLRAADVGAPHLRARIWVVAYANRVGRASRMRGCQTEEGKEWSNPELDSIRKRWDAEVAAASKRGHARHPNRMERLRALGNAQVPRVAQEAWNRLTARL